eukprot:1799919-Rhodomonas_salina.4
MQRIERKAASLSVIPDRGSRSSYPHRITWRERESRGKVEGRWRNEGVDRARGDDGGSATDSEG